MSQIFQPVDHPNMETYYIGYMPDNSFSGKISKFKIKDKAPSKPEAQEKLKDIIRKFPAHLGSCPDYKILTAPEIQALWKQAKEASKAKRLKSLKGTLSKKKAEGKVTKPTFVLCPQCQAKSKKLYSEMGGLQTRKCKNGHTFGYDTFGGGKRFCQTYDQFVGNPPSRPETGPLGNVSMN